MSSQNGTTDRIRDVLREHGPMTAAEIAHLLGDVHRDNIASLLSQRRKAGECSASVIDGKPTYALVPGYVKPRAKKSPWTKTHPNPMPLPPAPARAPHSGAIAPTRASAAPSSPASSPPQRAAPPLAASAAAPETLTLRLRVACDVGDLPTRLRALADALAALGAP